MHYILNNPALVGMLFLEHLRLTGEVLAISLVIAVPLGVLIARLPVCAGRC